VFGAAPPRQEYSLAQALVESGKMRQLDGLLRRLRTDGHKVLLFSQMTAMMNLLEAYLNFRRFRFVRLDGSCTIAER
jgi:DNA helicase INO80